jgi:hypothetical protein
MSSTPDPLLAAAIEAHGGAAAWAQVRSITAQVSFGGPFWKWRGQPDLPGEVAITVDPHVQRVSLSPFTGPGRTVRLAADPEGVWIEDADGVVVDERDAPRASFPLPFEALTTPWDPIQVAYFAGFANWTYLTVPFTLDRDGVEAHEIEPWAAEGGATWRRLAVTFPESYVGHNRHQTMYFDADDLLLRRNDYSPDVTSNPPIAHEVGEHRTFGGLVFPTVRRVYRRDTDGHADRSLASITMDLRDVIVETA